MSTRDHDCCETYAEARHQAPPGHFAVACGDDDCRGCALWHRGAGCRREALFGADAADDYPCQHEPDDGPVAFFHFRPLSEWKFGNEEGESP